MNADLSRLFDEHAAASFDKQLCLAEAVGEASWQFDRESGVLSFGPRRRWPAQLLGTESHVGDTWLWAWANPSPGLPARLLGSARVLKMLGEQSKIPELTEPQLPLGEVGGHFFSLLARGVCRAVAYFRAPYDGGAAFLLLNETPLPPPSESPAARVASVFPRVVASLPVASHKRAFLGHLRHYGLTAVPDGDALVVRQDGSPVLSAEFDHLDRLARLEATLQR
jgi:hypothetical protein